MEDPNLNLDQIEEKLPSLEPDGNYGQPSTPISSRKIFIGNIGINIDKEILAKNFDKFGEIGDIDMRGRYAFINFVDPQSAKDAVQEMHNEFIGEYKIVCQHHQPSNRNRRPPPFGGNKDGHWFSHRKGRTQHRLILRSLDPRCTWQNLKDFGRIAGDVNFANVYSYEGKKVGLIEYNTLEAQKYALSELPNRLLNERQVQVEEDFGQFDHLIQSRKRDRSPGMGNQFQSDRVKDGGRFRYDNEQAKFNNYDRYTSSNHYYKDKMVSSQTRHHMPPHDNGRITKNPHPHYNHGKQKSGSYYYNRGPDIIDPPHILGSHTNRRQNNFSAAIDKPNFEGSLYRSHDHHHHPSSNYHQHYYHGESPQNSFARSPSHSHDVDYYRTSRDHRQRDRKYYPNAMDSSKGTPATNFYRNDRNTNIGNSRSIERGVPSWTRQRSSRDKASPGNSRYYGPSHTKSFRDDIRGHDAMPERTRYDEFDRYDGIRSKPHMIMKEVDRGHIRRHRSRSPDPINHNMRYGNRGQR